MKTQLIVLSLIYLLAGAGMNACGPIKEIHRNDPYQGSSPIVNETKLDPGLPTVVILASNRGAEIFDLMAPYHLFSATGALNVVVVAPERKVLPLWKGLYLMPHMSLADFDAQGIHPAMIVIPNIEDPKNNAIAKWIHKYLDTNCHVMTVCEGARVIAENKFYPGIELTTHHTSINKIEKANPDYTWTRGTKYIDSGKISSTSGVSAAVEGSLLAIERLLGKAKAEDVMNQIAYPGDQPILDLNDSHMRFGDILRIIGKTGFTKNKKLAVAVLDKVSELEIAAIVDTYNRTFPSRLETISPGGKPIKTQYGLLLIPSTINDASFDEIILPCGHCSSEKTDTLLPQFDAAEKATVYSSGERYIFFELYDQLRMDYHQGFTRTVFRLMDYNVEDELKQWSEN